MWSLKVLIVLCTLIQWEANGVHGWWYPSDCYNLRFQNAPSGMYYIQPLGPNTQPIRVYCEMTIGGGGFTFLPRSLTRTSSASRIVRALFRDRYNVLLKLKKKSGSESYTLIQPHPHFPNTGFGVLVNSFHGYTRPLNAFMKEYIFLGIIPAYAARRRSIQGFKSNGHIIQFRNCDANPNSYFAFMPNHNRQTPSSYHSGNLIYEKVRVGVDWRSKAVPITNPVRTMPNEFFFLTELHFGGCGTYTSSNRWFKFGFQATAIGIR